MSVSEADRRLLVKHLPELRYHRLERYRADSAATLTNSYAPARYSNTLRRNWPEQLLAQAAPSSRVPRLSLEFLVGESEPYPSGGEFASRGDYIAAHGPTLEADAKRMHTQPGMGHVIYCRVAPGTSGRRWLQYWFFFYDNPFRVALLGRHQGDWEMIQVGIGADGKPFGATYAQHDGGSRREWEDVTTVDEHRPVVYVAKDSHASYFSAGEHDRERLPFGIGNDHTSDGVRPVAHTPHFLDQESDRWLLWPGNWGGSMVVLGESPPGPFFKTKWHAPEAFHAQAKLRGPDDDASLAEERPTPMAPAVGALLQGAEVIVNLAFPPLPAEGETDPERLDVAVHGTSGLPEVATFNVASLTDTVRLPLPDSEGPYTLHVGVYDEEDNELLLPPILIGTPTDESAALDDSVLELAMPSVPGPPPLRPPVQAAPLRLIVLAPEDDPQPLVTLTLVAERELGPGGRWTAAPLFPEDPSAPELSRWFALTQPVTGEPGQDVAAMSFEAARRIELPEGWTVQPDAPSAVVEVDPPDDDDAALDDEPLDTPWAPDAIAARVAWDVKPPAGGRVKGAGVLIGQPDTGYTDHPELGEDALDLLRDRDILTGSDDARSVLAGFPPFQFPSHGTGTSSVAVSRDSGEIFGVAPRARVVPIRAAETVIHIRNAELAVAVNYARAVGCHVITISMGGIAYPGALRAAIQRAVKDGLIVMAAAGQPLPMVVEPASYPECLAVGGTRFGDRTWGLSARGSQVDWCAPAKAVWVAATSNDPGPEQFHTAQHSGTSFSVALSAGVAALWLAFHGRETIIERFGRENVQGAFRSVARMSADRPADWDTTRWGAGILNAERLLQTPLDTIRVEPIEASTPSRWRWLVDRATDLAESLSSAEVERRLRALFDDDEAALDENAEELAFRLAQHARVRDELLGELDEAALEDQPVDSPTLRALASPSMRATLATR